MKAWMVTEGEYSDYRVIAVFTTESKAGEYIALVNAASHQEAGAKHYERIEEVDLDPDGPTLGTLSYRVTVTTAGDILQVRKAAWGWSGDYPLPDSAITPGGGWEFLVYARDEEHAKKIATERRQQRLAEASRE